MLARTHDLAAITALGIIVVLQPERTMTLSTAMAAIFANLVGGITPDIDQPTAPLWRNLPVGGVIGRIIDRLLGGHRFLTHSLVGLALFGFAAHSLLLFLRPVLGAINIGYVWWAYMIGMCSHLVMDTFTKEGVPWLLPVPVKFGIPPIKKLRMTTGKAIETFIVFPGLLALNAVFYSHNYQRVLEILHRHLT
ncbi:MAG TPA: metal-dependent hydrolase [Candidatus Limnocylindrales bacterium]|nr:metal-dependent hydrolase [Candidatus Limnocylindrales bacterium]